ncbi:hypothetical protein [Sodalis sp. RH19]|uniref:hypothetical protein n=1 Tax=Sodalis sp. RH19 TaxID=3394334 RepID=UPI0039B5743D
MINNHRDINHSDLFGIYNQSLHSHINARPNGRILTEVSNVSLPLTKGASESTDDDPDLSAVLLRSMASLNEDVVLRQTIDASLSSANLPSGEKDDDFLRALAASQQSALEDEEIRRAMEASLASTTSVGNGRVGMAGPAAEANKNTVQLETQAMAHLSAMPALEKFLSETGYVIRDSSGENNNCLFHSIVQCIYHDKGITGSIGHKAFELRMFYDAVKPGSENQGLFFDNNNSTGSNSGDATFIVNLVNQALGENIKVKLISPNIVDDGNHYITEGEYSGDEADNNSPVREIIILNTPGHYQSVVKIA